MQILLAPAILSLRLTYCLWCLYQGIETSFLQPTFCKEISAGNLSVDEKFPNQIYSVDDSQKTSDALENDSVWSTQNGHISFINIQG